MSAGITDPDVRMLAALSGTLSADFRQGEDPWAGSPFAWIRAQPSRRRGMIGEQLVAGFLAAKGFDVVRAAGSGADRLVNGVRAEIKFSTLWDSGEYRFQQIREQDYSVAICLGVSPFDAHCWALPREVLARRPEGIRGQHSGSGARETAWLRVRPASPHEWMSGYGGRLRNAVERLRAIAPRP